MKTKRCYLLEYLYLLQISLTSHIFIIFIRKLQKVVQKEKAKAVRNLLDIENCCNVLL